MSWALVFCVYTHACMISKDFGINEEKEICLSNKESINGRKCERKIWLLNMKSL